MLFFSNVAVTVPVLRFWCPLQDEVLKCIQELRSRTDEVRHRAAKKLRDLVKVQQREMTNEDFSKFMGDLNRCAPLGYTAWWGGGVSPPRCADACCAALATCAARLAALCVMPFPLHFVVYRKAFELVNSPENHEKLGGILAINELIDVPVKENETKMIRFANYLRGVFPSPTADADTLKLASKALGLSLAP
jgi:hypothetical protein